MRINLFTGETKLNVNSYSPQHGKACVEFAREVFQMGHGEFPGISFVEFPEENVALPVNKRTLKVLGKFIKTDPFTLKEQEVII